LFKRKLPTRLGSSELEAEPEEGSAAREEARRAVGRVAALATDFLPLLREPLPRADFAPAIRLLFLFALFFVALRFLAIK
jgi:hypothetical protein